MYAVLAGLICSLLQIYDC